jgi:hypothetical protein
MGKKKSKNDLGKKKASKVKSTDIKEILDGLSCLSEEGVTEYSRFVKELSLLIWHTKNLMNSEKLYAPHDQYNSGKKKMVHYFTGHSDLALSIYAPEFEEDFDKGKSKLEPAHISDGYRDERLKRGPEHIETVLRSDFTTEELLGLLKEIIRWYKDNITPDKRLSEVTDKVSELNTVVQKLIRKKSKSKAKIKKNKME